MNWYLGCFKKYFTFEGRARRREIGMFMLIHTFILFDLSFTWVLLEYDSGVTFQESTSIAKYILNFYAIITTLPMISVFIRRVHDIGKSSLWLLFAFIPIIGAFWLLALIFIKGNDEKNKYGPNPKLETERKKY